MNLENIMINPETLDIKLIDFGVAKKYKDKDEELNSSDSSYKSLLSTQSKD